VPKSDSPVTDLVIATPKKAEQNFFSIPDLSGPNHIRFLETIHATLRPRRYLELGCGRGETLKVAKCRSVSVDPALNIMGDPIAGKSACFLFRQTSDVFFRETNPTTLLGGPIDIALLDGPRLFERMLREFAAAERHCQRDSVIFLHDCIPTDTHIARRVRQDERLANQSAHPTWWAGDVWKAAALIHRYRPDLRIYAFNTPPTGLIAITNLDPKSTVLDDYYFALVREASVSLSKPADMLAFFAKLDMRPAEEFSAPERLSELFVF
jgi:hypothetical protein